MKLIAPLVLLGLVSLVEGHVVTSFATTCPAYFIKDPNNLPVIPTVPVGTQYKSICQVYKGYYRYATLYDTQRKIPVYSAYIFTGYSPITRSGSWMIEPQLDGYTGAEMTTEGQVSPVNNLGANQAVNCDYENTGYQKGHVYPHCQNCAQDQAESTFTLTNAAPQTARDNIRWFNQVEKKIIDSVKNRCLNNAAYVVTGVIPGLNSINTHVVRGRVNIPSYYWSAFCCVDKTQQNRWISEGYTLQMTGAGTSTAVAYGTPRAPAFGQMNTFLSGAYGATTFQIFGTIQGCS